MRVLLSLILALALPHGVAAQINTQSLEDIRTDLQAIDAQVQALRAQLVATGTRTNTAEGNPLERLEALERTTRFLTGRVEQLQNDVRRMAEDAGRRYSDVEFRLTEIEGGDTALLAKPIPLGNGVGTVTSIPDSKQTAISEQNAFDAASTALDGGDYSSAISGFEGFIRDYPGSPLDADARFSLAEARFRLGVYRDAAKGYLASFNADPTGTRAANALYGVGASLERLGQYKEACLTYAEVLRRFPTAESSLLGRVNEGMISAECG